MKVALVGPVYPYRGGIAHYTTMLYRELVARGHQASLYSFKRQYPRWLFPGPTDRDPSQQRLSVECKYALDSLNPFTWWTTAQAIRAQRPDVLLLQWWVPFFAPIWMVLAWAAHRSGIKTVFICHNVLPHEQRSLDKMLARWTLGFGDGFIVPSQDEREHLLALLPGRRVEIAPHPIYDMFAEQAMAPDEARKRLELPQDAPVLLFFGFVREYKGLRYLLEAMPEILAKLSNVRLLVVGEFWQGKQSYLDQIARLGIEQNVMIVDEYVPNEQVPLYFSAADVVVLPYTDVTQSGVVQLAFGFGVPVITTRVGGLPEVVADSRTGFLVEPGDVSGLSRAIVRFFRQACAASFRVAIEQSGARLGWGKVVAMTLKLVGT